MLEVDHRFDFKLTLGTHHISALRGELWGTYYELSVKKKECEKYVIVICIVLYEAHVVWVIWKA